MGNPPLPTLFFLLWFFFPAEAPYGPSYKVTVQNKFGKGMTIRCMRDGYQKKMSQVVDHGGNYTWLDTTDASGDFTYHCQVQLFYGCYRGGRREKYDEETFAAVRTRVSFPPFYRKNEAGVTEIFWVLKPCGRFVLDESNRTRFMGIWINLSRHLDIPLEASNGCRMLR